MYNLLAAGLEHKYFKVLRNKELVIVFLVLMVLGMIMIPMPPEIMDAIITVNIGLTVSILMLVIYSKSPLALSSFPSILLFLALLRIGITISTSRLILLNANAGEIVSTFGNFVAGDNLIVGVIIFAIITLINFIVITKGSERVAEVAARFSLDGMPGKQMSIDSDLRANSIDMKEAQRRRKVLELESKLYGAMDGAMKFVKGDAIASIIDIIINLCGGVMVGMGQHNLDFSSALQTYCILTIGDGLVQQIPALVVSLSSGILITHVNDDEILQSSLASNVVNQIFSNYKALFSAALLFIIMAFIPGMPSIIFAVMVLIVSGIAYFLYHKVNLKNKKAAEVEDRLLDSDLAIDGKPVEGFRRWSLTPLMLYLSPNLKSDKLIHDIKQALTNIRNDILIELGVEIPSIVLSYNDKIATDCYQLLVNEIPTPKVLIPQDSILAVENNIQLISGITKEQLPNLIDFGVYAKGVWINKKYNMKCEEYNIYYLHPQQFMIQQIKFSLNAYLDKFLGMQEVKNILDGMIDLQDLIRELLRMLPLNRITEVLQRLINEGISIRDFKTILDAMLESSQQDNNVVLITEQVRKSLGRYIAYKFSQGSYLIPSFLLSQELEGVIRDAIRSNHSGSYLSIDPDIAQDLINKLEVSYQEHSCDKLTVPVAIVTQMDIRRFVRGIIEKRLSHIPVLSMQELENLVEFNVLGVIDMELKNNFQY